MDGHKVNVNEDYQYSVYVSYVEIYNNYTYDLLDAPKMDIVSGRMKLTSKMLREDSYRNMYVHGAVEVEVKSPEEALETFYKGQKQRRVAETQLNIESSRSHSIFTLKVVAVPMDALGEDILSSPHHLIVSQLALVDLAGSERTARTGNTGARLQEASKINQSLMTLRTCIEVLRENQKTGGAKPVPYRDSRVTHLFRNFFEGDGKVKMVVCINPRNSDYDENVNVMKFAELTQEVQIERAKEVRWDNGLTPGRRRANQVSICNFSVTSWLSKSLCFIFVKNLLNIPQQGVQGGCQEDGGGRPRHSSLGDGPCPSLQPWSSLATSRDDSCGRGGHH